ncbi:E3 ubiquitin-protein ligase znrf1 isoform X1 [Corythoichthys intestinalis]|uniref:E3 ubiquitin-protein ligase znrf1 isoform X1 n=1 Tax=Corythoichthys intestinalis TaxID=161448 RepID=UPI0025A64ADC|nr:E3 ubiquitin-protein ligase znrf1 isoform X1 [Corythoichthys intestinalis]
MGGKQSTAGRSRGAFPGVSTDDSAVPPSAHFGHYRSGGTMGLRSRSVSSVAAMAIEQTPTVPFGFYTPRGTDSDRAGGGSGGTPAASHGTGYQDGGGGRHHADGVLYLGSRGSLADTLPLHIAPRWFSAHSVGSSSQPPTDLTVSSFQFLCSPCQLVIHHHSLCSVPSFPRSRFKCPVCSKSVASSEMEVHFIMCLSKPRLSYNDDVLARDAGECVICLEELQQGDTIARLPCLCIYHKSCIDSWFEINRSCPEHPSD